MTLPARQESWVRSLGGKIPWRRKWQPTPVFLPGEFPWADEPGGLRSMGSQRVRHSATKLSTAQSWLTQFHILRPVLKISHDTHIIESHELFLAI